MLINYSTLEQNYLIITNKIAVKTAHSALFKIAHLNLFLPTRYFTNDEPDIPWDIEEIGTEAVCEYISSFPGIYTFQLTVTGEDGLTESKTVEIQVPSTRKSKSGFGLLGPLRPIPWQFKMANFNYKILFCKCQC